MATIYDPYIIGIMWGNMLLLPIWHYLSKEIITPWICGIVLGLDMEITSIIILVLLGVLSISVCAFVYNKCMNKRNGY